MKLDLFQILSRLSLTFTDLALIILRPTSVYRDLCPPGFYCAEVQHQTQQLWNGLQLLYKNSWQFTDESMRLPEFVHGFAPQMFTIVYCVLRCVSTLFHWWHFVVRPLPMSIATSSDAQKAGIQDRALLDTSWNKARTVEIATWCEQLQLWTCFE